MSGFPKTGKASVPHHRSRSLWEKKEIVMVAVIFKWKSQSHAESHWEEDMRFSEPEDMISLVLTTL